MQTSGSSVFQPHRFSNGQSIDLYHVYDNLSQTPFLHGIGIQCGDPDIYWMDFEHVILPSKMREHLDWNNRMPTQFISFYSDLGAARQEMARRQHQSNTPGGGKRDPSSVRMAHVRLSADSGDVWPFSRSEMLAMIAAHSQIDARQLLAVSGVNEWFVWGCVPEVFVCNKLEL